MKLTDFIVCEDIRDEINGQQSLIGVFHENIIFNVTPSNRNVWPKNMSVAVFVRVSFDQEDIYNDIREIKLFVGLSDDLILLGSLEINKEKLRDHGQIVITAVLKNFPFKNTGDFSIHLKAYNEKNEMVSEILPSVTVKVIEVVVDGKE